MRKKIILLLLPIFVSFAAQAQDLNKMNPATPGDNDRLIAAYMSSKDANNILRMLTTYAEADDGMLKDARRFAYLSSQFKNPNNPRHELQKTAATAAVTKYECSSHSPRCNQFMTIASGMWALDSLSQRDPKVKDTVTSFLNGNPRMKKIYEEEGAMFSNYEALVVIYAAQPDKVDAVLTSYEKLGPLDMDAVHKNLK
jgi:hypothetical protein